MTLHRHKTGARLLVAALVCLVASLTFAALQPAAEPAVGVGVIGDDERDLYSGSGAVILPTSVSASTRHRAASCPGCRWKVTMPCLVDDGHQDAVCRGVILGCHQGREIRRVWLATPGRDLEPVGMFCPSDGEAVSVAEATSTVRGGFTHRLPALGPVCEPPRGAVVGIPLHCRSGQPAAQVEWNDQVVGFAVRTRARARWSWQFAPARGEPVTVRTGDPGGAYPRPGVQHAFSVAGPSRVSVQAAWDGEFWVDELGPFPITEQVTQQAQIDIPIGSAVGVIRP